METIDKQNNNTDSKVITKEENQKDFIKVKGRLTIKFKDNTPKCYHDYCKDCKDENQKLTTASNIVLALSGVFTAYETMNKEQFEQIVHSFITSE